MSENVDFVVYFADIIKAKKLKKREIATRSGLSVDYAYKLLNGNKKTEERDYIIALCVAAEFSLEQIKVALHAYPMPALNEADKRDAIIVKSIENHRSVLELNDALEAKGQPILRTSNSMQKHEVVREIERKIISHGEYKMGFQHFGNAPFDRYFVAEIKVTDSNGKDYYLKAYGDTSVPRYLKNADKYNAIGENYRLDTGSNRQKIIYLVTDEPLYEDGDFKAEEHVFSKPETPAYAEEYDNLEELEDSIYFKYFVHMKTMVENKMKEYMDCVDDTRNHGSRWACKYEGSHRTAYIEVFNSNQPEKEEYLQVVDRDGVITFSATHESIYMRIELGKLYAQHFGVSDEVKPYISINSIEELGEEYWYFKEPFMQMQKILEEEYPNKHFVAKDENGNLIDMGELPPNLTLMC